MFNWINDCLLESKRLISLHTLIFTWRTASRGAKAGSLMSTQVHTMRYPRINIFSRKSERKLKELLPLLLLLCQQHRQMPYIYPLNSRRGCQVTVFCFTHLQYSPILIFKWHQLSKKWANWRNIHPYYSQPPDSWATCHLLIPLCDGTRNFERDPGPDLKYDRNRDQGQDQNCDRTRTKAGTRNVTEPGQRTEPGLVQDQVWDHDKELDKEHCWGPRVHCWGQRAPPLQPQELKKSCPWIGNFSSVRFVKIS